MRFIYAGIIAVTFVGASPAPGHHSDAGFDTDAVVAFRGTVTEFSWRNPHVYINVETTDESGERVEWEVETGATPIMARSGWTRESLTPGEAITVRGHPERDSRRSYALLLSIEKNDGTVLTQRPIDAQPIASTIDLSGVWKGYAPSLRPFYQRLGGLALTVKGAAAKAEYDFYSDSPAALCVGPNSPAILATGLYLSDIEVNETTVSIRSEFFDADRTVFMDGRGHPENGERTSQGHSIGWWEDAVLVVDTVGFANHRTGNGNGVPSGAQKHVIERYKLSEDGTRLLIDIFLEDPEYLAEPFTGALEWTYTPDLEMFRYDCDPEVSRRFRLD